MGTERTVFEDGAAGAVIPDGLVQKICRYVDHGKTVVLSGMGAPCPMPPAREIKRGVATLYQRPLFDTDRLFVLNQQHVRELATWGQTGVLTSFSAALDVNCVSVLCRALTEGAKGDAGLLLWEHVRQLESRGVMIDSYPFFLENSGRHRGEADRPLLGRLSEWLGQAPGESVDDRVNRWLAEPDHTVGDVVGPAYLLLVRACVIANTAKRRDGPDNFRQLAQYMQTEMGALALRCFSIVSRLFSSQSLAFFKGLGSLKEARPGSLSGDAVLRKCQNVAWDVAHIMMLELTVEPRVGSEVNVPVLLTFDRSLAEMASLNTISALVLPSGDDPVEAIVGLEAAAADAIEPFTTPEATARRREVREASDFNLDRLIAEAESEVRRLIAES